MKKNGFTLIELLAVIIILGILMIIAIPSVTKYIGDSRKNAYIDTAKEIIAGARNLVNEGKLEMYDTNTTYYIPSSCIKTENASKSPYGEFIKDKTYVVVTYDGKGYSYYWVSLDDAGQGVSELKSIDELDTDDIKSDLTRDDIKDNIGVGGRDKVTIFNETCTAKIDKDALKDVACKRATELHTATCKRTSSGCYDLGYYADGAQGTNIITYGNLGSKGVLNPGDAFDCDVDGNGVFDKDTERFYYISKTGNDANSTATLIYYSNVNNGVIGFDGYGYATTEDIQNAGYDVSSYDSIYGPVTAYQHLPSTSQWKSTKIEKEANRSITNESGTKTVYGGSIVDNFVYSGKAARLLTYQEVQAACGNGTVTDSGYLNSCLYLLENTLFEQNYNSTSLWWLETPVGAYPSFRAAWSVTMSNNLSKFSVFSTNGIRPAIDVKLLNIDY